MNDDRKPLRVAEEDKPDTIFGGNTEEVRKALRQRPVLVLFYMDGCSHCERNQPAWDKAEKKVKKNIEVVRVESKDVPPETGVTSFPTMMYTSKKGKTRTLAGAQESGQAILSKLGVKTPSTRRARRTRHTTLRKIR